MRILQSLLIQLKIWHYFFLTYFYVLCSRQTANTEAFMDTVNSLSFLTEFNFILISPTEASLFFSSDNNGAYCSNSSWWFTIRDFFPRPKKKNWKTVSVLTTPYLNAENKQTRNLVWVLAAGIVHALMHQTVLFTHISLISNRCSIHPHLWDLQDLSSTAVLWQQWMNQGRTSSQKKESK